ncbi:MAG: hypothetical protein IJ251_02540 [Oscillospiraceae bacterium]|nr:hypothetical protein [Oscillospiraceae bacterium]
MEIRKIHMGKARFAVDLGDGSERGEYVNQDYILHKLGRPHRAVSLMYCYYPFDKEFPGRISEVMKDAKVSFQWDYPYDDYFTYKGGIGGNTDGEPFGQMRDIRRHGQDVNLTLTLDPNCTDEQLIAIAKDLRPFGRMMLRINHEATGSWFSFTKRASYKEVGDFFVHFTDIIHEYAPNVKTVVCIGGIEDLNKTEMEMEEEFKATIPAADIWSVDKYMALHWGWPYDVAKKGGNSFARYSVRTTYEKTKASYERFRFLNGGEGKPMTMAEFNADGDVTGPYDQAAMVKEFCDILVNENADWFSGFTFYQFRDRGRLGLEIEDPNYPDCGIEQPVLKTYKQIIHSEPFKPAMETGDALELPVKLRWGGAEDSDGISIPVHFDSQPHFCELYFEDEGNYIIEINGRWFYKSPSAKVIDLMEAFYECPLDGAADMDIKIFAPPAAGENDPSQGESWATDYYYTMEKLPEIRIECEPVTGRID